MQRRERIESITRDICSAFEHVARDDGTTLHEARLLDDQYSPTDEQLAAARALDTDLHWNEVPPATIHELSDALTFLDARGRQYYLPAFMVFVLTPPAKYDSSGVEDSVVQTLINLDCYGREFDSYTKSQKGAAARFLRYMVEEEGAFFHTWEGILRWADDHEDNEPENAIEEALKNYWSRF